MNFNTIRGKNAQYQEQYLSKREYCLLDSPSQVCTTVVSPPDRRHLHDDSIASRTAQTQTPSHVTHAPIVTVGVAWTIFPFPPRGGTLNNHQLSPMYIHELMPILKGVEGSISQVRTWKDYIINRGYIIASLCISICINRLSPSEKQQRANTQNMQAHSMLTIRA